MEQMEFNLLDEPWIRVMTEDCTVVERSLMQVLLNSHQYQRLAGELPTQDVALLRLLLAILQTVFYRVDPEGEDDPIEDRAAGVVERRSFPGAADSDVPGDMEGSLLAFPSGASVLSSPGCGGGDEIQSVKTEWGVVRERP